MRIGCFGGEAGAEVPPTRKKIETRLGIDACDCCGLAEIGPTCASECGEKAGIHWAEDHLLLEIIDRETKIRLARLVLEPHKVLVAGADPASSDGHPQAARLTPQRSPEQLCPLDRLLSKVNHRNIPFLVVSIVHSIYRFRGTRQATESSAS